MEQNKSLISIFSIYKIITIFVYIYITFASSSKANVIALFVAIILVLLKAWFIDRPFIKRRRDTINITKYALIFLIIADINLIMIIPALFDLVRDVVVNFFVESHADSVNTNIGVIVKHRVGLFSSSVIVLYVLEQQVMKYINFQH